MKFLFTPGQFIKRRLLRTSLKNVLLWLFIPVFVLCVLVNLFLTNILIRKQIKEDALVSISELVSQTRHHLDYRLYGIFEQLVLFEQSPDMAALIADYGADETRRGEHFVKVFNDLSRIYTFSYSALDTVFVAIQQGARPIDIFYQSDYPPAHSNFSFSTVMNGQPLIDQGGRLYQWFNLHENNINPNLYTENRVASLYKFLGDRESASRCFLMFNFKNSFFRQIFGEIKATENGYLALLGDGAIMDFKGGGRFEIGHEILEAVEMNAKAAGHLSARSADGSKILVVWESLQLGRWKLAAIFPESDLVQPVNSITLVTVICSVTALFFALALSLLVIRLVQLLEEEQKRKQDLRVLHEQIKPHFLYNALSSIEQLGIMGEYEKMTGAIRALTGFYRLGLSKGRQLIALKDEIAHAQYYLDIQMMQSKKLSYQVEINPEFMDAKIPKLSLQPILENAIVHGMKHGENLHVHISAKEAETGLCITISDNGIGIPDDKLTVLCGAFANGDWSALPDVFGIRNVHERIRLHYGIPYGVSVKSVFEQGMMVTLLIPPPPYIISGKTTDTG